MLILTSLLLLPFVVRGEEVYLPSTRKIDCADRSDGFYVVGCNDKFTRCYNKKSYEVNCPVGLFFDSLRGKCEYKDNVNECKTPKAFEGKILRTPSAFNCTERKDGSYVHPDVPCDQQYYTCVHNVPVVQLCPHKQFFDEENQRCEFQHRVAACAGRNEKISGYLQDVAAPAEPSGYTQEVSSDSPPSPPPSEQKEEQLIKEVPVEPTDKAVDCKFLGDGVFRDTENKCAEFFWKCSNEKVFKYKCQLGLFFDAERTRCDHRQYILDCGGKRQASTPAPIFDSSVIDFDCKDKADDFYVKEPCPSIFYHCNGGIARQIACASDLVYDVRIKACDYPEACRAERSTPEPPSIGGEHGAFSRPAEAEPKIEFDCSSKKDGMYAIEGCMGRYVQCTAGKFSVMKCPGDLVFNEVAGNCDYKENCAKVDNTLPHELPKENDEAEKKPEEKEEIEAVNPYQVESTETTSTSPETAKDSTTTVSTTTTTTAQKTETSTTISCAELANGPHAVTDCSADYVECWDGQSTPASCSHGLMFNTYNGQCDYKDNVPGCNPGMEFEATSSTPAADKKMPATAAPQIETAKPTNPVPSRIDPYCERLADGFYGSGCNNFFYSCHQQATYKMQCPSGLFYDTVERKCDRKANILACGGKPKKTVKPESENMSNGYGQSSKPESTPTPATARPTLPERTEESPVFSCIGKKDGLFALPGCSPSFVQCYAEKKFDQKCQKGLFYNDANGMCDYKENVPACGGRFVSTKPTEEPKIANDTEVQLTCLGEDNGYHAMGCSADYYSCRSGLKKMMRCPSDLRFSAKLGRCDYASYVSECDADADRKIAATTTSTTTSAPAMAEGEAAQEEEVDVELACANKAPGFYAVSACSPKYVSCQVGLKTIGTCPSPLIFNEANGICDYHSKVPTCSAQTPQKIEPVSNIRPEPSPESPIFSCQGRRDGNYATADCSNEIIQCSRQMPVRANCPNGMVFNRQMGYCDVPRRVPGCASTLPERPAFTPQVGGYSQVAAPAPQPQADTPNTFACTGKPDGIYGYPCRSKYWRCASEIPYEYTCSTGLLFDLSSGRCNYPAYVQGC